MLYWIFDGLKAYSYQSKANATLKKIKERVKKIKEKTSNIEENVRFHSEQTQKLSLIFF